MNPTKVRHALALRRAGELLRCQGAPAAPPVDVRRLAAALGVHLASKPYEGQGDVAGLLLQRDDAPTIIGTNAQHSEERQRFVIAHELGHLTLHKDTALFLCDAMAFKEGDWQQTEANLFALELLLPAELLAQDLAAGVDFESEEEARALGARYHVSPQVARLRLGLWSMRGA